MSKYSDKMPPRLLKAIQEGRPLVFYKSPQFRYWRGRALARDNNECQMCKEEGKQGRADAVHHIIHLKDRPELGLRLTNLVCLCKYHHNIVHQEKLGLGDKSEISEATKKRKLREKQLPERWE